MTKVSDSLLEKISALLRKAEGTDNAEEAEAYTAKATELIAKYGIDQAMIPQGEPGANKASDHKITCRRPWAMEKAQLCGWLAQALRCEVVLLPSGGKGWVTVHIFGYDSDLRRSEMLYNSLVVQMTNALAAATVPPNTRSPRAWRRSFLLGFSTTVVGRVKVIEDRAAAQAHRDSGGKAELVLADRAAVARRLLEDYYPLPGKKKKTTYTGSGYHDGRTAGERADIGQPKVGGRRPRGTLGR
ncbi:DUF2786 domain-containing protein [Actinomadura miaoliensis]|uniref:DUF2786 domain-containing protein n=1 Tax=Actinomadura miaoliensis TaxID=430685 RepID=A0ABP7X1C8_9ACTN